MSSKIWQCNTYIFIGMVDWQEFDFNMIDGVGQYAPKWKQVRVGLFVCPCNGIYTVVSRISDCNRLHRNTGSKSTHLKMIRAYLDENGFKHRVMHYIPSMYLMACPQVWNMLTLNWMRTFLFVLVPSGHRNSCGNPLSGERARATMSAFAFFRFSGVLLEIKGKS